MNARRFVAVAAVLAAGLIPGLAVTLEAQAAVSDPIDPTVPVAVTSWGDNHIDMFAKGTDNTLKHRVYNGRWSAWESLGGAISSAPSAVSWAPGRIDIVARDMDGSVLHRAYENGIWYQWDDLGGGIIGDPSITSWGPNRLDIVVRGTDNAVWQMSWVGYFTPWTWLDGIIDASPTAISWGPNRLDIFAKAGGDVLFQKFWDPAIGGWSGWNAIDRGIASAPSASRNQPGYLNLWARLAGGGLGHKWFGPAGWSAWENVGGTLATAPAAVDLNPNHMEVFGRDAGGVLQQLVWNRATGWDPWRTMTDDVPNLAPVQYTSTRALQATPTAGQTVGAINYAYVDNLGRVMHGYQSNPMDFSQVQWTNVSGLEAFSGPPSLIEQSDGDRLQITAKHSSRDLWTRAEVTKGAVPVAFTGWVDQGGQLDAPIAVEQTDGSTLLFAMAANGTLWWLKQPSPAGPYGTWTRINTAGLGTATLTGQPAIVPVRDGLAIFARDSGGVVRTTTLSVSGTSPAWVSAGGGTVDGNVAAVVVPGYRVRLFARMNSGQIVTKMQDASMVWPAAWTPVGAVISLGTPAVLLSPLTGRFEVVTRAVELNTGTVNLWGISETAQGSGTWGPWQVLSQGVDSNIVATDPTILLWSDGTGQKWGFVWRDRDQRSRVYEACLSTCPAALATADKGTMDRVGAATSAAVDAQAGTGTTFKPYRLPKPPA